MVVSLAETIAPVHYFLGSAELGCGRNCVPGLVESERCHLAVGKALLRGIDRLPDKVPLNLFPA